MAELIPGLVSVTFRELQPAEILDLCVRAKLEMIEWGGDVHVPHGDLGQARKVARLTEDAGLQLSTYSSFYRAGVSEHDGLAFETVVQTAKALGASSVRVWSGNKASHRADAAYRSWVVDELKRISCIAADVSMSVVLECHSNTLTDTYVSTRALLDEVDQPNCKVTWQIFPGQDFEVSLEGLHMLKPELHSLHVTHFGRNGSERKPITEAQENWMNYLELASDCDYPVPALLEFVKDDDPQQFLKDASQLCEWAELLKMG